MQISCARNFDNKYDFWIQTTPAKITANHNLAILVMCAKVSGAE